MMGSAFPYPGFTGQKTIYMRAIRATLVSQPKLETSEVIRVRLVMPAELMELIRTGIEVDGILCTALFFNHCQHLPDVNS
jgi:ADP-ribose pyrophosphatase